MALLLTVPLSRTTAQSTVLPLVPRPVSVQQVAGSYTITASTIIATDRATRALGYLLSDYVGPATGFRLAVQAISSRTTSRITIQLDTSLARLGA
ncbi:MAG: hypothetical protein ACREN5_15485, partial [Gemmatimonadales bacterium]